MSDEFLTPRRTSELLKVTTKTLQNWDKEGKIKSFRTTGGHRRFALADIRTLMQTEKEPITPTQTKICYCRVSTPSQKEDLERQVEFFRQTYPTHRIVQDIGSGLNFKRKGLQTILDIAIAGDLSEVVVTHRDRLCRFGFELIEGIITNHSNGKIVVLDNPKTSQNQATSFQSSQFSPPDSTASVVIPSGKKSEKQLKTMKFRLLPSLEEKAFLQTQMEKFRWFYNSSLTVLNLEAIRTGKKLEDNHSFSYPFLRDSIVKKYKYTEEVVDNLIFCDYVYDEENTKMMSPEWMTGIHSRLQRGAIQKLSENINSALSNKRSGNIKSFMLSSKSISEFIHFEDKNFPTIIKGIDSRFWFTDKSRKRQSISFRDVFNDTTKKGLEIIHDKITDTYSLHYPVDVDYFPTTDRRGDNQARYVVEDENRFISLDPGVRKFMVGYDPQGKCVIFGEGANRELSELLYKIDESEDSQERSILFRRIHNLVEELHWKTISFLIAHYDTILLPDFRISGMVRGKKLAKITKRLLYMFSFNSFRRKLEWKCRIHNKKLCIVDESYTSKTCGGCGVLNNVGSSEKYTCKKCGFDCDRDVIGSRNIMIKNLTLRLIPDFPVSK